MRILVLSFYYRPDLCAGAFRVTPLVGALRERAPAGTHIDVLTTLPNRYASFAQDAAELETSVGLEIRRVKVPVHRSDMRGQSRAFMHFARQCLAITANREYDIVLASSSRLMTATLGAWIARRKGARLYLDIRDIFVDTIKDILPPPISWLAKQGLSMVESWTIRRADRINFVSRGFEEYFRARYGERSFAWYTNGIDEEFVMSPLPERVAAPSFGNPTTLLYAGNIGEGQGLHKIIPQFALALHGRARFVVIGDGGRRELLEREIAKAGADNVSLHAPMGRAELLAAYRAADVLFLHLGAHAALEKVLPSKIFEYAALGKPVLAGVAGFAARFIREEIPNAAVFTPVDVPSAVHAFESLELRDCPRPEFTAKYARSNIARAMADDVLSLRLSPA